MLSFHFRYIILVYFFKIFSFLFTWKLRGRNSHDKVNINAKKNVCVKSVEGRVKIMKFKYLLKSIIYFDLVYSNVITLWAYTCRPTYA